MNPLRVAELAERLGWRALVAAILAPLLALPHVLLAVRASAELHDRIGIGLLQTALCCLSGLYWATFLFRLLGVWCYRCRR
jgi:hypothetical protein